MAGLTLARSSAPAEVQGVDDPDIERKMKTWVKDWPKVEAAYADLKKAAQEFIATNREINHAVGQKLRDKSISREQKKALEELLARSSATHDAVNRLI
jgi:hypothetical protein